jgi:hypothetical protein
MAQGRIIVNAICADKRINLLSDDTSRLAFTWLITFADCEGRTHGDPAVVRSMLFPRRDDVSIERMETYIREWATLGLIIWYEIDGDLWIYFPTFDKNQPGIRKDREAPSRIPGIPNEASEQLRTGSGSTPAQLPVKLKEKKGNDSSTPPQFPPSFPAGFIPRSPEERIYCAVTNHPTIPGDDIDGAINAIAKIQKSHGWDEKQVTDYLHPFWEAMKKQYPQSARTFWLTDWAVTGHIPQPKKNGSSEKLPTRGF